MQHRADSPQVDVEPSTSGPHRPVLRPGTHVLRRSAEELQVGLDPRRAVVLPDREPFRGTLTSLCSPAGAGTADRYDELTLSVLREAGHLVDADLLLPLVPNGPGQGLRRGCEEAPRGVRGDVAALAADVGDGVVEAWAGRRRGVVEVHACGAPGAREVARHLVALLGASSCTAVLADERGRPASGATGRMTGALRSHDTARPVLSALVAVGEHDRDRVDGWMRDGTPHALLRLAEGEVVLGPFVVPGTTACLRCVDAHHTDVDPAWPLLVTQYADATKRSREDTLPEPVDPLLAALAAAWTARDLVSHLEGRSPSTASTTLRLDARLTSLEVHTWARHPSCGCAWWDKPEHPWAGP